MDLRIVATVEPAAEASIDGGDQGVVTWTLDADLERGAPPDAGFLAYGCTADDGDRAPSCGGHVSFSVQPRSDLSDATTVSNDADITFDELDAVVTDPASMVTIESKPPDVPFSPSPPSAVPGDPAVPGAAMHLAWEAAYSETQDVYVWNEQEGESRPASSDRAIVWELALRGTRYPPGESTFSLPPGESWLWQLVARNARGEPTEGPIWRFTTGASFRRGDADRSGNVQITDAIFELGFLFLGGDAPPCLDALDVDDSGSLNITDPILMLSYLFLGGADIPPPGPVECGLDPTADVAGAERLNDLGCADYGACE